MQLRRRAEQAALIQFRNKTLHLRRAEEDIYFGKSGYELLLVALDHAADRDNCLALAFVFVAGRFDDRIDRFFLRCVDEAARVHDDHVRLLQLRRVLGRVVGELSEIPLAVDGVLVAAEGDEPDLQRGMRDEGCGIRVTCSYRTSVRRRSLWTGGAPSLTG